LIVVFKQQGRVGAPKTETPWKPVPGRLAPRTGFEPVTYRLTAGRSTVELSRKEIWM
jgi:hypothetical protein